MLTHWGSSGESTAIRPHSELTVGQIMGKPTTSTLHNRSHCPASSSSSQYIFDIFRTRSAQRSDTLAGKMQISQLKEEFSEESLPASENMVRETTHVYQLLTYSEMTHIPADLKDPLQWPSHTSRQIFLPCLSKWRLKRLAYRGAELSPGWGGLLKHILLIWLL